MGEEAAESELEESGDGLGTGGGVEFKGSPCTEAEAGACVESPVVGKITGAVGASAGAETGVKVASVLVAIMLGIEVEGVEVGATEFDMELVA